MPNSFWFILITDKIRNCSSLTILYESMSRYCSYLTLDIFPLLHLLLSITCYLFAIIYYIFWLIFAIRESNFTCNVPWNRHKYSDWLVKNNLSLSPFPSLLIVIQIVINEIVLIEISVCKRFMIIEQLIIDFLDNNVYSSS